MVTPSTAMEWGLVDAEAGPNPDVEVADGRGRSLGRGVGVVLMPPALAGATFGQRPAALKAVSGLRAGIPRDLHAGEQVDLDRHAGRGTCPVRGVEGNPEPDPRGLLGASSDDNPGKRSGQ